MSTFFVVSSRRFIKNSIIKYFNFPRKTFTFVPKTQSTMKDTTAFDTAPVSDKYENWFLDYASYVILERAVPDVYDGLKPVQRRILHAMYEMEDGRYNKVANIIGQTMQYHPHGDASISEAIVNLGQKDLLIDTQGNWGDIRTGDGAAAARYIEARLSKFAQEILFNPQTTDWQLSYDGRKREPIVLPAKFPLLLAQGVEGIAVGLSTKVLPHNFCELIKAAIEILKGKTVEIFPDFPTGGMIDVSDYKQGGKGSKVRVRAKIEELDNKTLIIKEIPFTTTTTSLMESIVKANDAGKIKIKKVIDNTAKEVEIQIQLAAGTSPDVTIAALYAFTDCEVSISPNACVIVNDKPQFLPVNEILRINTLQTRDLLRRELEIRLHELKEKILFSSLEKIFIENRIYRDIEEATTWEEVLQRIDEGLKPYKPQFYREITQEDLLKLTEIKIKRISKYDTFQADEQLKGYEKEKAEVEHNLANLTDYTINYYKNLLTKYGKGRERKTEIRTFDTIVATKVVANNQKLYVDKKNGFVGYGLKKDENVEMVAECSDIDDVIVFLQDGRCRVVKIADKTFVAKDIIHAEIFYKDDERKVYNLVYLDGETGTSYVKRFQMGGVTREKDYDLTKGSKGSKILYFTANPNGEAEIITVQLTAGSSAKNKIFDFNFAELDIKGRSSQGNILTKYPIKQIKLKVTGVSTLGGQELYYDETIGKLNKEKKGKLLGTFTGDDKILVITKDGSYELTSYELTNRYQPDEVAWITKFNPDDIISAVHYIGDQQLYFVKRFKVETTTVGKKFNFISDSPNSKLLLATTNKNPQVEVQFTVGKATSVATYDLDMLVEVKGWRALGNKLTNYNLKKIKLLG
jgi:topoisomerase-4 subunit A